MCVVCVKERRLESCVWCVCFHSAAYSIYIEIAFKDRMYQVLLKVPQSQFQVFDLWRFDGECLDLLLGEGGHVPHRTDVACVYQLQ